MCAAQVYRRKWRKPGTFHCLKLSYRVSVLCSANSRNQGHCHNKCYIIVLVTQSCLTVCNPVDCSPPGSSVHEILQAWILEWVAMPFSRGSSWPKDGTQVSCIAGRFFTILATREYCYLNGKKHLGVTSVTGVASLPPSFRAFLFNCLISRD